MKWWDVRDMEGSPWSFGHETGEIPVVQSKRGILSPVKQEWSPWHIVGGFAHIGDFFK